MLRVCKTSCYQLQQPEFNNLLNLIETLANFCKYMAECNTDLSVLSYQNSMRKILGQ